jgi:hypothetical protein
MIRLRRVGRTMLASVALSSFAHAAGILDDTAKDGARFLGGFVIGNQFTVGAADVSINALGVWDQGGNGLVLSHDVGLWNSAGALVASATVPAGTSGVLDDAYRYVTLGSNVTLLAGQQYRVAALFQTVDDPFNDPWDPDGDGNPFGSPAVGDGVAVIAGGGVATVDGDYFAASGVLVEPVNFGGGTPGRWGAANARFVPEPTSIALGGMCGVLTLLRRKLKRSL